MRSNIIKRFHLVIVQSRATQLEGPLFRLLSKNPSLKLSVYYTRSDGNEVPCDLEVGHKPDWSSQNISSGYQFYLCSHTLLGRFRFMRELKFENPDLIIIAGYVPIIHLLVACWARLVGIPVGLRADSVKIYRTHNITNKIKYKIKELLFPLLFKTLFTTGHPTGSLTKEYFIDFGFREQSLFLFPYNVNNNYLYERCISSTKEQEHIRKRCKIGTNDFVILGVLKFILREDPITLLIAFARIIHKYPQAHLVMVGDGDLRKNIDKIVEEKKLIHVHFPGFISYDQLPLYYGIADVFVHPAVREPWGCSVNEAMACSVPVIVADTVGSGQDLVNIGETGFVFKHGSPKSLTFYIEKLLLSPDLRRVMKQKIQEKIKEWDFSQTEKNILQALEYVTFTRKTRK